MQLAELEKLFERARRVHRRLAEIEGGGTRWEAAVPGGPPQSYSISKVKPPEEIEDDIAQLLVWLWSLKDHLRRHAKARGLNPQAVDDNVNAHLPLQIVADLANREKHGSPGRNGGRSGRSPAMKRVAYRVDSANVARLIFTGSNVHLDPKDANAVTLTARAQTRTWISRSAQARGSL